MFLVLEEGISLGPWGGSVTCNLFREIYRKHPVNLKLYLSDFKKLILCILNFTIFKKKKFNRNYLIIYKFITVFY